MTPQTPIARLKQSWTIRKAVLIFIALLIIFIGAREAASQFPSEYQGRIDHSQPSTYENGCHLNLNEYLPKDCFINQNSDGPLVYLYGDSHAAQWVPALEIASKYLNFKLRIFTKSSCPFLNLNLNANCNLWQENVIHEISRNKPAIIILASMTNAKYYSPLNDKSYNLLWEKQFYKTLQFIKGENQVILIQDTPYSLFDTTDCLTRNISSSCNFKFRESKLSKSIREISDVRKINYLSINNYLCPDDSCIASNGQFSYYFDKHHISVSLSKSLSTQLIDYLEPRISTPN